MMATKKTVRLTVEHRKRLLAIVKGRQAQALHDLRLSKTDDERDFYRRISEEDNDLLELLKEPKVELPDEDAEAEYRRDREDSEGWEEDEDED